MARAAFRLMREADYYNPWEWDERLYFDEMNNKDMAELTGYRFTGGSSWGTHPVFILRKIEKGCYDFCPCSSQEYNRGKASFIRKGSKTSPNSLRIDKNSYILHFYSFNLLADSYLVDRMPLRGKVNEEDIEGNFHLKNRFPPLLQGRSEDE